MAEILLMYSRDTSCEYEFHLYKEGIFVDNEHGYIRNLGTPALHNIKVDIRQFAALGGQPW